MNIGPGKDSSYYRPVLILTDGSKNATIFEGEVFGIDSNCINLNKSEY